MNVSRRGFLQLFGAAAVAPKYFFAPPGGWQPRVIATEAATPILLHPPPVFTVDLWSDSWLPPGSASRWGQASGWILSEGVYRVAITDNRPKTTARIYGYDR